MRIFACLVFLYFVGAQENIESLAVKSVIKSAYIEGIQIEGNTKKMKEGLHKGFVMKYVRDNTLKDLTRDEWAKRIDGYDNKGAKKKVTYDIPLVDITGNVAIAKINVYKDGKHVYTDYMSLYKIDGAWKIVTKTFHSYK